VLKREPLASAAGFQKGRSGFIAARGFVTTLHQAPYLIFDTVASARQRISGTRGVNKRTRQPLVDV
jgi:hypothetical protein